MTNLFCDSNKKSEQLCTGCLRDIHISQVVLGTILEDLHHPVKNLKDKTVKCKNYKQRINNETN